MSDRANKHGIRVRNLIGYGSGSMVMAAYFLISGSFLLFATAILGVPPEIAGLIMAVSTLWDAVIDIPLGWVSDHLDSKRFGRRHPFLAIGGIGVAVLTIALWSIPQGIGMPLTVAWLALSTILLKTAIAAFVVPHTALGGEIVDSYDARMVVQGYRAAFQVVGMMFALVGSSVYFFRPTDAYPQGQLNPQAYLPMGLACGVLVLLATLSTLAGTWRYIPRLRASEPSGHSRRQLIAALLRDRDLRALTLMILAIELTFQIGITLGGHIQTYTYGLSGPQMGILGLALLTSAALSQPVWIHLSKRFDKKPALFAATLVAMIGFVGAPLSHVAWHWFPLAPADSVVLTLLPFQILAGAGTGAFWSLPYAMVSDCAQARERDTGVSVSGSYTGMYIFAYKLGSSVSIAASGWLLQVVGYDHALAAQSGHTRYWLAVAPALLIIASAPVVLLALRSYRLSRSNFSPPPASA